MLSKRVFTYNRTKSMWQGFLSRSNSTHAPKSAQFPPSGNAVYMEQMYEAWKRDPSSVHISWKAYFDNLKSGLPSSQAFQAPPALLPGVDLGAEAVSIVAPSGGTSEILDHLKVQMLVRAYQVRGHHIANLDPLGILNPDLTDIHPPELEIGHYGFTEKDLDRVFYLGSAMLPGFLKEKKQMTLREIVASLKDVYCGTVGIEYAHNPDRLQCDWLRSRFEVPVKFEFTKAEKQVMLDRLIWSDSFEKFVATKWSSEKRFGLEGCESLIPGMKALIDRSVDLGVKTIVMGMPHRGRLNVLSNVVRKPNESIFCEFSGTIEPSLEGSGDVKYHLGMNYDRPTPSGKMVHLSLCANPSHLEAVDPVVLGKVKANQHFEKDDEKKEKSMALLLHGDAAVAGQGVVYETFGFSELPSYSTGGTIHIVVNNQIGFTTDPRYSRSTPYCTDVAKTVQAPIIHVNGDDIESVVFSCILAAEWRQKFKKDIVIDIICYRKYGHNEIDQPAFTQPKMYKKISEQKSILDKYVEKLIQDGTFTVEEIEANKKRVWSLLEDAYKKSKDYKPSKNDWLSSNWPSLKSPKEMTTYIAPARQTGAELEVLKHVGNVTSTYPADFNIHPVLNRILKARKKAIDENGLIDWPTAEAMAFGSLVMEGTHVRLSGQDVERGTFSQRHAVLHDQGNEKQYVPLNNLSDKQARFTVCNSSLSEFGVLGFELGYSLANPNTLIMWEAQFGDFANNAQCIIDQFIASGESKWMQRTGLTLLLPHGFDGAGPEHSSARMERFLQLCDDNPFVFPESSPEKSRQMQDCNMQVVYCSTPANYFHALRRQVHRDFRKPLIVLTSKSLLRHPMCKSSLNDMAAGTQFQRLINETDPEIVNGGSKVKKVIFCSGQVYYALAKTREANNMKDIAIARVEQISPFPYQKVLETADQFPEAEIVWAQEEPLNNGAWTYVEPRIETALTKSKFHAGKRIKYAGRDPSGSVATGNKKQHEKEELNLLSKALVGEIRKPTKFANGLPIWD